jgi:hypothetical protein
VQLGHAGKADGRWRLYAFAGGDHLDEAGVRALCGSWRSRRIRRCARYTRAGQDIDAVFDLRAIFQQGTPRAGDRVHAALLLPRKGRHGLRDYEKVFCPDLKNGPDIFDLRGIDRAQGALVVVRPDQYIAHVLPLDAHQELAEFFAGFMLGTVAKCANRLTHPILSTSLYLGLGWLAVFILQPLMSSMPMEGLALLVTGGALYTLGAVVFHFDDRIPYGHFIWHLLVLGASGCHFLAVLRYAN